MLRRERIPQYISLMRLDRPIGILLLLWPTLWALWLASSGQPDLKILLVFISGVFLMRSAGCAINDFADQDFDGYVKRTADRPLVASDMTSGEALFLAGTLSFIAFLLVLLCNYLTIILAFVGLALTIAYPFMKRYTYLPQFGLGAAFTWGVPMAFAAQTGEVSMAAWLVFLTGMIWPVIYDTMYAMVDKEDDIAIGVKSTAILFAHEDRMIIASMQTIFVGMLMLLGWLFQLHYPYYFSLMIVAFLFSYQQWLIKDREPEKCFKAFLNNNWVGFTIFIGIFSSYLE